MGYNIWPNEVINEIRRRGIPMLAGNYDFGVGRTSDDCGCAYKTDEEKPMALYPSLLPINSLRMKNGLICVPFPLISGWSFSSITTN